MTALFARTDVVGFERMAYELTPEAIELGLGDALPAVFVIGKEREFGRSKVGATTTAQLVWILGPRLPEPERMAEMDEYP